MIRAILSVTLGLAAPMLHAQTFPRIRPIGQTVAVAAESLRGPVLVRALSDGGVLVNESGRGRVIHFDPTLSTATVALDSPANSGALAFIPLNDDSTLYADMASSTLLVLDAHGRSVRAIAMPTPTHFAFAAYGNVSLVDTRGRLIYRGAPARKLGTPNYGPDAAQLLSTTGDSAPIIRADFETRRTDTIGFLKVPVPTQPMSATIEGNTFQVKMRYNPLADGDDWVALADRSIAIVRAHDYHVDWIDASGKQRSTGRMPFAGRRLSDEDKVAILDSVRPTLPAMARRALMTGGAAILTDQGTKRLAYNYEVVSPTDLPDYVPALVPNTTKADLSGNLWVLPRTAVSAGGILGSGVIYDVVNQAGTIVERVQLPPGRLLAGFGLQGVAYLLHWDGSALRLECVRER